MCRTEENEEGSLFFNMQYYICNIIFLARGHTFKVVDCRFFIVRCDSMLTDAVAQLQNESCPLVENVGMAESETDFLQVDHEFVT